MKKIFIILGTILTLLSVALTGCTSSTEADSNGQIALPVPSFSGVSVGPGIIWSQQNVGLWVNGEGKVYAATDIATLGLGVEVQKMTVAEAQSQAAVDMDRVMKVLKANGIAEKDIQTQQYSIYPVKQWDEKGQREVLLGYRVTNMVTVKIRKLADVGDVIDGVALVAGDSIRINSISFSIDDPSAYYQQAREKAVKDAMEKAKQIAGTSNIKLGKLLYISETGAYLPQPIYRDYAEYKGASTVPAVETSISGGEQQVTVNIQMVYDID